MQLLEAARQAPGGLVLARRQRLPLPLPPAAMQRRLSRLPALPQRSLHQLHHQQRQQRPQRLVTSAAAAAATDVADDAAARAPPTTAAAGNAAWQLAVETLKPDWPLLLLTSVALAATITFTLIFPLAIGEVRQRGASAQPCCMLGSQGRGLTVGLYLARPLTRPLVLTPPNRAAGV